MNMILKLTPVISILLVFVTWGVVYINAIKIASRAETKSINDELFKIINKINELAISFWSTRTLISSSDLSLYRISVSSELSKLINYNDLLSGRGVHLSAETLANYNEIITLDCEKKLLSIPNDTDIEYKLNLIVTFSSDIQIELYKQYEDIYKFLPSRSIIVSLASLIINYDKKLKSELNKIYETPMRNNR